MAETGNPRRISLVGPIILIALGGLLLLLNFHPEIDPWPILARYWPLILIFIGLGKLWDSYWVRQHPEAAGGRWLSGPAIALLVLLLFFVAAVRHGRVSYRVGAEAEHDTQAVELGGAKTVRARLEMGAGLLRLSGGSSRLLDADFRYGRREGKPRVEYHVSGDEGQLDVAEKQNRALFGNSRAEWDLRFGENVPLDLRLDMGAGENNLRLAKLNVNHLEVHMGAGELNLDLTGVQASHLDAIVEGGAGQARIHVPKDIGTRIHASGGIGTINVRGLTRDGDAYVNEAYGKTPATIELTVNGGVGEIDLIAEP